MRMLITGGTGLIGRRLCGVLLAEGHELTVFSRNPASVPAKCGAGVHALGSLAEWRPDMTFDAVINLAGEPIIDRRWTAQRKRVLWDSRVTLTEELVRRIAAAEHKPSVLLSGSAVGYYGDRGDLMLDEAAHAGTGFAAELCKAWEDAALVAKSLGVRLRHVTGEDSRLREQPHSTSSRTEGLRPTVSEVRTCLLRTAPVLSSDGGLLGRMVPPFRLGLGARLGDGKQWMSWVHIEDYVAMVLRLLRDEQMRGPYNMAAPHPVTNAEFTATLAAVLHRPAWLAAPAPLLRMTMGESASLLLESQRVLPRKMEAAHFRFAFPTLAEALHDLV